MAGDHFSGHATDYARFRPGYPEALFDWIAGQTPSHELAWDCGCGNGQASMPLAARYSRVVATDMSPQQIAEAKPHQRIEYRTAPAEASGLDDASTDAVTIAQALHWFDFDRFYSEVRRVQKPGGIIVAWTYQLLRADSAVDALLADFYGPVLGSHWPPERKWVDTGYRGMPFPFAEIETPHFEIRLSWTLADLLAYLGTWSATQRYRKSEGRDPIPALGERLAPAWGDSTREIIWPIAMRAGHV
jgi:ubiquinone/menaquinone biosynthesis C-methylase UbiE